MELPSKVKQKPILFVNTESFLNEENLKKMETFSESQGEVQRTCLYIQGSVHQNHIDAPFVLKVCNFNLSKSLSVHTAMMNENGTLSRLPLLKEGIFSGYNIP